jgi:MFS family permease
VMLFLIGTFGMNFPIFISTMAVTVFHAGAGEYGLLTSIMAIGTITGALLAAGREKPRFVLLIAGAAFFGLGCTLASVMPNYRLFGATLVIIGVSSLTFSNSSNSLMQLATEPIMRGRVMAMRLAITLGGTPIGAPLVGWVADHFGPRWSLRVGAAAGLTAALVGLFHVVRRGSELPAAGIATRSSDGTA